MELSKVYYEQTSIYTDLVVSIAYSKLKRSRQTVPVSKKVILPPKRLMTRFHYQRETVISEMCVPEYEKPTGKENGSDHHRR